MQSLVQRLLGSMRSATFLIAGVATTVSIPFAAATDFVVMEDTTATNAGLGISANDRITVLKGVSVSVTADEAFRPKQDDVTIENSGSLSSTVESAVRLDNVRNTLINNRKGEITSDGGNAVDIRGADAVINNAGIIRALSGDNHAVRIDNAGAMLTNSGKLISNETGGNALFLSSNATDTVVNLNAPTFAGGAFSFADGSSGTLDLQSGKSHSVLWNTKFKQENLTDSNELAGITIIRSGAVPWFVDEATGRNATYDPSGLAGAVNGLGDIAALISHLNRPDGGSNGGINRASFGLVPNRSGDDSASSSYDDPSTGTSNRFWISAFGGVMEHEGGNTNLDQTVTQAGLAAGYSWHQSSGLQLGAMAGYIGSDMDSESSFAKSHDIETKGFVVGFHGTQQTHDIRIQFGVSGGWFSHDGSRFINDNLATTGGSTLGLSSAHSSYDSWVVSPEIGISTEWEQPNGWTFTPALRLRYAAQFIDRFTESRSNANAAVGSRNIGIFEINPELVASRQLEFGSLSARAGFLSRSSSGDDNVSITMLGVTNRVGFGDTGGNGFYAGVGAEINMSDNLRLELSGAGYFGDEITGYQGMARLISRH